MSAAPNLEPGSPPTDQPPVGAAFADQNLARTTLDFWDIPDPDNSSNLALNQDVGHAASVKHAPLASRSLRLGLSALFLAGIVYGGLWFLESSEELPMATTPPVAEAGMLSGLKKTIVTSIQSLFGLEPPTTVPPAKPNLVKKQPRSVVKPQLTNPQPAPPVYQIPALVPGNPYWHLPAAMTSDDLLLSERPWTPDEEEAWRAGLSHRYVYQHYKAVQDIRQQRRPGSEAILWDALNDKKFWTRMQAAIGLAEFNVDLPIDAVERALGNEISERTANFFERFRQRNSAAERVVMRQALKLVDERARLVILQGLIRAKEPLRDLYLLAATQDPGYRVQRWAMTQQRLGHLSDQSQRQLLEVVQGKMPAETVIRDVKTASALPKMLPKLNPTPARVPNNPASSPLNKNAMADFEDFEDSLGDVEFYNDAVGTSKTTTSEDLQTFDLQN